MQDDDYMSDEELESKADQEVEDLINGPSYRCVPSEDYRTKLPGIDAKKCWLKCIETNQPIPANVIAKLFETIKSEVETYEKKQRKEAAKNKKAEKYRMPTGKPDKDELFELLHIAKTDSDLFWKKLHGIAPIFKDIDAGNKNILDTLKKWLPVRKDFEPKEIYAIFEQLGQGNDKPPIGPPYLYEDSFAQAFREWRNTNKK